MNDHRVVRLDTEEWEALVRLAGGEVGRARVGDPSSTDPLLRAVWKLHDAR